MLLLIASGAAICLGLHFSVLVLLPVSMLAAAAFIFWSWFSGQNPFDNAGMLLGLLIAAQAGFMLGLTARETYVQLLAKLNIGQSGRI
jgi:nitric oxide reductase large subunit